MITHLRIDNRLIHGQVAVVWMNSIGAKAIIVVNDQVAADPIQKMALPLAARGNKVLVLSVQEMIDYAHANPDETLFVVCKLPTDALRLIEAGLDIEVVNVGNAAPVAGTKYVMVTKSIAATAEDAAIYRQIAELRGGSLTSRMIPTNEEIDFLKALRNAGL